MTPAFSIGFLTRIKKDNLFTYPTNKSAGIFALNRVLVGALSECAFADWLTSASRSCVCVVKIMNAGDWTVKRINLGLLMISQTTRASLSQVAVSSTPLAY